MIFILFLIGKNCFFFFSFRFGIYEQTMTSDNETTAVEDWFKSQGHTLNEPKVGIRQRLKNAYIGK